MLWQFIFEAAINHSFSDKGQEVTKFIVLFDSGHSVVSSRVFDEEPRKKIVYFSEQRYLYHQKI